MTTKEKWVYFDIRRGFSSIDSIVMKAWVNYYDNCITVDFLKIESVRQEGISTIWIDVLRKRYNTSLMASEIIPLDRNIFTDRTLKSTKLFYNGPNIALEKGASDGAYDDYILELKQDTYMENAPSKNCRTSPFTPSCGFGGQWFGGQANPGNTQKHQLSQTRHK